MWLRILRWEIILEHARGPVKTQDSFKEGEGQSQSEGGVITEAARGKVCAGPQAGMRAAPRSWERQGHIASPGASKGTIPADNLILIL